MSEDSCIICNREKTKYKCISCKLSVCQVCSLQASSDDEGYDEEFKFLGWCSTDCKLSKKRKKLTVQSETTNSKKKQRDIKTMLKGFPVAKKTEKRNAPIPTQNKVTTSTSENKPRVVTVDTVESSWKFKILAMYNADDWLSYDTNGKYAINLTCSICQKYEKKISGMKFFRRDWIDGCTNYRPSCALDHAKSEPHKEAMKYFGHETGKESTVTREKGQESIIQTFSKINKNDQELTQKKFEVAYFIAKEELPMSKYPKIIDLEEKHGIKFGNAYRNSNACAEFIDFMGDQFSSDLSDKLSHTNFFSVLWDGTTDKSATEKEALFVQYFDAESNPSKVSVKLTFMGLQDVKYAHADGIKEAIKKGFEGIGIADFREHLIGLGADGASVNSGQKTGVQAKMKEDMPWIIFVWCMAHRLELAIKDVLSETGFKDVDEMLLRIFYLYEKSPKKLRELKEVHELIKETFQLDDNGVRPIRASGTRWIAHKVNALKRILDKFGIYITHLENLTNDTSYSKSEINRVKGYLSKWKTSKMLSNICFYLDILLPLKKLSELLQQEEIDTVKAANAINKAKSELNKLKIKSIRDFPNIKVMLTQVTSQVNCDLYKGVTLYQISQEIDRLSSKKEKEIDLLVGKIVSRMEENDSEFFSAVSQILNCEGWERYDENNEKDLEFADAFISQLFNRFEVPLRKANLQGNEADVLSEWHELLQYALEYMSPSSNCYLKTWKRIFKSQRAKETFQNILLLVEISFCLPVTTAKLERSFSMLKRLKTDMRSSIGGQRLENIMRIGQEGPPACDYNVLPAMRKWAESKVRRPSQKNQKRNYKQRISKKSIGLDSSDSSDSSDPE